MRLVDTAVARRNVEQLVVVELDPELFGERLTYLASSAPVLSCNGEILLVKYRLAFVGVFFTPFYLLLL